MATKTKSDVVTFSIPLPGDVTKDRARVAQITLGYELRGRSRKDRYQVKFKTLRHGVVNGYFTGNREDLIATLVERGFNNLSSEVEVELQISNRGNWYIQLQDTVTDTVADNGWGSF